MENYPAPSWLDKGFIREILRSMEEVTQEVEVLGWSCQLAVPSGNNHLSQLYRVRADYKTLNAIHKVSVIIKTSVEPGMTRDFIESVDGHRKELLMYQEVLPQMYKLHKYCMSPRSFACSLRDTLALEDLQSEGFRMADRYQQLDIDHCRPFFITLARIHALSMALHHKQPDLVEEVGKQVFFAKRIEKEEDFWKMCLNSTAIAVKQLEGCEKFSEKLASKVDSFYKTMERLYKPTAEWNVLNHGDCWTNNILFKYNNSGVIVDVKLVDFQLVRFCSFAHDIHNFWWTSANEEVRKHHREEMFEVYRTTLNTTLEDLGCRERLSKEEFETEMKTHAPIALQTISFSLTMILADPKDFFKYDDHNPDDFTKCVQEDSPHLMNYQNKYYKAALPSILRDAEVLGVFT